MRTWSRDASVALAVALFAANASCVPGGGSPSGAEAARTGHPAMPEGERLYLTRCTACHAAEPVADYAATEWREIIPDMAERSKLTPAQQQAVLDYVLSAVGP